MSDQSPHDAAWRQTVPAFGPPVAAEAAETAAAAEAAGAAPADPNRGPEWIPAPVAAPAAAPPPAPPGDATGPPAGGAPVPPPAESPSHLRSIVEWVVVGGSALILALLIRAILFQTFFIPSASMTPTLRIHDRILVNKLAYDFHPVHRGDIVVFKRDGLHGIPNDEIKNLVKRVIGLPGETIQTTAEGHIEINGTVLNESYLPRGTFSTGIQPTVIPAHHYWVMGDNRSNSADSRVFGPIDKNLIVGRAFVLIWPLPDLGLL
jgi:signal peptidase I